MINIKYIILPVRNKNISCIKKVFTIFYIRIFIHLKVFHIFLTYQKGCFKLKWCKSYNANVIVLKLNEIFIQIVRICITYKWFYSYILFYCFFIIITIFYFWFFLCFQKYTIIENKYHVIVIQSIPIIFINLALGLTLFYFQCKKIK